jgi:hypothetical protein
MKTWQVPKIWEDSEVWILGGGPSLIDCFNIPAEIVNDVRLRKAGIESYSPYLAAIHSKHVIGINVAYQFGNWVDICFFGDKGFYLNNQSGLSHFRKLVVTCCEKVGQSNVSWIKYLPQEKEGKLEKEGISTQPDMVCWNKNSGAAAISVAAWAGAKRIVLVGFDMNLDPASKEQHFHNSYREKGKGVLPKQLPFPIHLKAWSKIKSDADNMGIEILNTSLNSAIQELPKVHIKELL